MTRQQIEADWAIARAAIENCLKLHTTYKGRDEPRRDALKAAMRAVERLYAAAVKAAEPESLVGKRVLYRAKWNGERSFFGTIASVSPLGEYALLPDASYVQCNRDDFELLPKEDGKQEG